MLGGSLGKGPWFPFILVALSLSLDSEYLLALRRKKTKAGFHLYYLHCTVTRLLFIDTFFLPWEYLRVFMIPDYKQAILIALVVWIGEQAKVTRSSDQLIRESEQKRS